MFVIFVFSTHNMFLVLGKVLTDSPVLILLGFQLFVLFISTMQITPIPYKYKTADERFYETEKLNFTHLLWWKTVIH